VSGDWAGATLTTPNKTTRTVSSGGQSRSETGIPSDEFQPTSLQEHRRAHHAIGSWGLAKHPGFDRAGVLQVPQHAVLATGGAKGAVGRDGDCVDVAGVADVVGLDAAGGQVPNLW
jgi:hypothetical protein